MSSLKVKFEQSATYWMKWPDESHLIRSHFCVSEEAKWWERSACWHPTAQSSETTLLSQRSELCVCVSKSRWTCLKTTNRTSRCHCNIVVLTDPHFPLRGKQNPVNKTHFSALHPKHFKSSKSQVKLAFTSPSRPYQIQRGKTSHPNRSIKAFPLIIKAAHWCIVLKSDKIKHSEPSILLATSPPLCLMEIFFFIVVLGQ